MTGGHRAEEQGREDDGRGDGGHEDDGHGDGGHEGDILGPYLELLRSRLDGERFEVLIRAVQSTCALLGDGHQAVLDPSQGCALASDLQREYLSLMAVMITGHLDHRLVELTAADGSKGWAVVDNTRSLTPGSARQPGRRTAP